MGLNRVTILETVSSSSSASAAGFVAIPPCLMGASGAGAFQSQIYQWAFEQAQAAVAVSQAPPPRVPDLFAVFN